MYKILQIGLYPTDRSLIKGGIESAVFGLTKAFSELEGYNVKIITFPNSNIGADFYTKLDNIEICYLSSPFTNQILSILRIIKIMKEIRVFKPDVVHLHGTNPLYFIILIILKLLRINTVITVHGILSVEIYNEYMKNKKIGVLIKLKVYSILEKATIKKANKIIVDTEYVKTWILNNVQGGKNNIQIIPQGIDSKFYRIEDNFDKNLVITIAGFSIRKGHEYAIRAIAKLIELIPDLKYYILGFNNDKQYFKFLENLILELNLTENIYLVRNADNTQLNNYLSKCNIFILHSQEESQGIVFCEAMAAGKPIVATNVGGIPYVIKHQVNGYLSEFKDIDAFSQNIEKILLNPDLRREFSSNNRKESYKYDWDRIAREVQTIYTH